MVPILSQKVKLYRVHHKKNETLTTNPPIHIYINRINNSKVLKIKDEYKIVLKTHENMKLFGSTKTMIEKTKKNKKDKMRQVLKQLKYFSSAQFSRHSISTKVQGIIYF